MTDNKVVRISDLAKELDITNKKLIESFAKIGIIGKNHASAINQEQINKLKDYLLHKKSIKKTAFVIKKKEQEVNPEQKEDLQYQTIRICKLAIEIGITSKDLIKKFEQIGIFNKTPGSTVTAEQVAKLKNFSDIKKQAYIIKSNDNIDKANKKSNLSNKNRDENLVLPKLTKGCLVRCCKCRNFVSEFYEFQSGKCLCEKCVKSLSEKQLCKELERLYDQKFANWTKIIKVYQGGQP